MTIMGWAPQQGAAGGSPTFEACGRGYIAIYIMVKHLMEILLSALFVTNVPPQVQVGYKQKNFLLDWFPTLFCTALSKWWRHP